MAAWIVLLLILFFNASPLISSAASELDLQPQELARLKKSGVTEAVIQSKVEEIELLLAEKRNQAQLFQFVPQVIASERERPGWSIASGSQVLFTFRDNNGYLSTKTRAEVVARQLNRALEIGDGEFTSIHRNGQSVVIFESSKDRLVIVSGSERDAAFFSENKSVELTATDITQQWADVLNHFWHSLPPVLLRSPPDALTFPDLVLLSETSLADYTLLTFLHFRQIDHAVKVEQIKGLGFSKEIAQYLTKRVTVEAPDRMRLWGYSGSYNHCGNASVSISGTVSVGASGRFHFGAQKGGLTTSSSRSSPVKGSHSGVRGRNFLRNRN